MKEFLALLLARNKEFIRDRGSVSWNFVFPVLIIIGCAVAFSRPDQTIISIGLHGNTTLLEQLPFVHNSYVKSINYDSLKTAQQRVKKHQLDLLISNEHEHRYWINPESPASDAANALFLAQGGEGFKRTALGGKPVRYVDWVMPGVLGMNIMFGSLFGVGYVIVRYRQNGVLKRLQATPVRPISFIAAQLVSRIVIVTGINAFIFIGCYYLLDLVVAGNVLNVLLLSILGAISMVSMGLLIAARTASEELAGGLVNLATWPMMFLSEVWFPLDQAPDWLRKLSDLMPLTHLVKATRAIMIDGASLTDVAYHIGAMTLLTGLFLMLAARLFRWHQQA